MNDRICIEISSSSEDEDISNTGASKSSHQPVNTPKTLRSQQPPSETRRPGQFFPVVELSDSEVEVVKVVVSPRGPRLRRTPAINATAGPSRHGQAAFNTPGRHGIRTFTDTVPLFLPNDAEDSVRVQKIAPRRAGEPMTIDDSDADSDWEAQPIALSPRRGGRASKIPVRIMEVDSDSNSGQNSTEDLLSTTVARVLEVVPDIELDHLTNLIQQSTTHPNGLVDHVVHTLLEDPNYPKVKAKNKGKQKETARGDGQGLEPRAPLAPRRARGESKTPIDMLDVDADSDSGFQPTLSPEDVLSLAVARVLEVVPDVEPDHLTSLIQKFMPTHPNDLVDHVLHTLFEDPAYPKVKLVDKGKRKETAGGDGQGPRKRNKVDYGDKLRPRNVGVHYLELSLAQLQKDFSYTPKTYLRQAMASCNRLYAPTHILLLEQEEKWNDPKLKSVLPYTRRATAYKPRPKGPEDGGKHDEEFERERVWVRQEIERRDLAVAEQVNEEEYEDCGAGIECSCCFSTYPFDKMVQCPETHLFCSTCVSSYAATLLGTHDPNIKCMHPSGCTLLLPESELRRVLPEKSLELWDRVRQRKALEAAKDDGLDVEECPFCDWACVVGRPFEEERLFRCGNEDVCGVVSCRGCKKPDHLPRTCKEVVEADKALDGRHAIEEAMSEALMRICPKCSKPFVKEHGCNMMTCICGARSCYVCKKAIKSYTHFTGRCATIADEALHADDVRKAAEKAQKE
ncbi:hypothetical protein Hypma_008324 [Hypsizygus marmoreus]|uniref:RING-type domain-containing protein n=1 Tax=Hypsizygus marmoreus TaxID=39966 RepID=A0A369JVZ8_HYPMA|nr:hypothetical protein Hypma_008324 [Hypsizygus marmoreus]